MEVYCVSLPACCNALLCMVIFFFRWNAALCTTRWWSRSPAMFCLVDYNILLPDPLVNCCLVLWITGRGAILLLARLMEHYGLPYCHAIMCLLRNIVCLFHVYSLLTSSVFSVYYCYMRAICYRTANNCCLYGMTCVIMVADSSCVTLNNIWFYIYHSSPSGQQYTEFTLHHDSIYHCCLYSYYNNCSFYHSVILPCILGGLI